MSGNCYMWTDERKRESKRIVSCIEDDVRCTDGQQQQQRQHYCTHWGRQRKISDHLLQRDDSFMPVYVHVFRAECTSVAMSAAATATATCQTEFTEFAILRVIFRKCEQYKSTQFPNVSRATWRGVCEEPMREFWSNSLHEESAAFSSLQPVYYDFLCSASNTISTDL